MFVHTIAASLCVENLTRFSLFYLKFCFVSSFVCQIILSNITNMTLFTLGCRGFQPAFQKRKINKNRSEVLVQVTASFSFSLKF